jgi:hypothetical protein
MYAIVKCGIAAQLERCVGKILSTQRKIHKRKIKTTYKSHFTTHMKEPAKYQKREPSNCIQTTYKLKKVYTDDV